MMFYADIAGVVLAGGRSQRMGKNKAMLQYKQRPLLDHMIDIVNQCGVDRVYISGQQDGYACIEDDTVFAGPAMAMQNIVTKFDAYDRFLFVPVDMPFLTPDVLMPLMSEKTSAYYTGWPLPCVIKRQKEFCNEVSVKELLKSCHAVEMDLPEPFLKNMRNINTPQEWERVVEYES